MSQNAGLPAAWADSDTLAGFDLIDKAELIGVPFRIRGIRFTENARGISYVYVDAELAPERGQSEGPMVQFNDSSSGVRMQLIEYVNDTLGRGDIIDSGDPVAVKLVIPRGLRFSDYDVQIQGAGSALARIKGQSETRKARTYYLTTDGTPLTPLDDGQASTAQGDGRKGRQGAARGRQGADAARLARGSDAEGTPAAG